MARVPRSNLFGGTAINLQTAATNSIPPLVGSTTQRVAGPWVYFGVMPSGYSTDLHATVPNRITADLGVANTSPCLCLTFPFLA